MTHEGTLIENVGWLRDHTDQWRVIAHDSMILNYVCPSKVPYPIEWHRFEKRAVCEEGVCKDYTELCIALIDDALKREMPGAFTFDSFDSNQAAYVGNLKFNRKVVYGGREQKLQEVARPMPWEVKKSIRVGHTRYWYFSKPMRTPDVGHPVRVVLFWHDRGDQEASKALVGNRLGWEVIRMVLLYRYRRTGTETFHQDGKQQLGLGECQAQNGEGQARHAYLVSTAYSLFMRSLQQNPPQDWPRRTLTTIGEACRAVKAETLTHMIDWVVDKLTGDPWSVADIKAVLVYA